MPSLAFPCVALSPPAAVTWLLSGGGGIISGSAVVDINCTNNYGVTPLHCASIEGKTEMVRVLLGLPRNLRPDDGSKAAFEAIFQRLDPDESHGISLDEFLAVLAFVPADLAQACLLFNKGIRWTGPHRPLAF